VRPHFQPQTAAEIDQRVVDIDKLRRKGLDGFLINILAGVRRIGIVVREYLPQTIVKLQDFTASPGVFLCNLESSCFFNYLQTLILTGFINLSVVKYF
jgi:hypothetical protein